MKFEQKIKCLHSGCNKDHKIVLDWEGIPKICGVHNCNRLAQGKIRQGFTFYEVCMIHAQGEVIDKKEIDYGA